MWLIKPDIETWGARLIWLSFFLPAQVQTSILIAWSIWIGIKSVKARSNFSLKTIAILFFLGLGYWFYLLWLPFTEQAEQHIIYAYLERKVSLVLLPIVIYLSYQLEIQTINKQLHWFVWGTGLKFIWANAWIIHKGLDHPAIFTHHVMYRDAFNEIAEIHPTYFGIYLVFSLAILVWRGKGIVGNRVWLSIIFQVALLIFLLMLSPKTPMLAALMIYGLAFFCLKSITIQRKIFIVAGFTLLFVVSWFSIPFFKDRILEVTEFATNKKLVQVESSMEIRSLIFKTDLELLKNHWLVGLGPAQLEAKLNTCFFMYSVYLKKSLGSYNTHNEFFNQWLCFGLGGIIYFLVFFVVHIKRALKHKDFLYLSFLIIFMVCCLTENVLSRQQGIIFFALIGSVFFLKEHRSTSQLVG
ncbi:MAG: O-antigen ligase family protein [Chitinophagaceae bacterium]|nr:O-antigen ligase family protein [Chitinophagaceae bacterium]